ncbi:MAG: hypothetical protein GY731_00075, partial [Gammaproteobacteria bacterium]|nr:hypothetical protein [Gammaproteobacteria bacterium]
ADEALQSLQTAFKQAGGSGEEGLQRYTDELAALKSEWERRVEFAATVRELDGDGMVRELGELIKAMNDLATAPELLTEAVEEGERSKLEKRLAQSGTKVRGALEELRTFDLGKYRELLTQSKSIASGDDLEAAIEAMDELKVQVDEAIKAVETRRGEAEQKVQQALKIAKDAVNAMAGLLKRSSNKFFKPYFEGLREELLDLEGMAKSTSIMTLTDTASALLEFKQRVVSLTRTMDESESGEQGGTSSSSTDIKVMRGNFQAVIDKVSDISTLLNDANLKTCMESRHLQLTKALKEKQDEVRSLPPREALKVLVDFEETVSAALTAAEEAAGKRSSCNTLLDWVKGLVKKIDKRKGKVFVADLWSRIKGIQRQITTEGQENQARDAINDLFAEITEARESDERLLAAETRIKEKKYDLEKAKKAWLARVKGFKKVELARAVKAVRGTPGGDKSQIEDLKRLVSQAQKLASAQDYDGANGQLDGAVKYALRVIESPQGLKASSRGKLPRCNARWQAAVKRFNVSVDAVSK